MDTTTGTSTKYSKIINEEGIQLLEKEKEVYEFIKNNELLAADGLRSRTSSVSSFVSTKSTNSFYDTLTISKEQSSKMVSPSIIGSSSFSFISNNKKNNTIITKLLNVFTNISTTQFKLLLLLLMVIQNSSTVLVGRYTRIAKTSTDKSDTTNELYNVGHLIMITEISKLLLSIVFEYYNNSITTTSTTGSTTNTSSTSLSSFYKTYIIIKYYCYDTFYKNAFKICIPSILYLIQNTLLYIALENLTAPIFQVTYQGKLVTTALVSVVLLNRSYNIRQWICLICISFGVAIVVLGEQSQSQSSSNSSNSSSNKSQSQSQSQSQQQNLFLGLTSVSIACFSSALAGVYFEMVLKKQSTTSTTTTNNNNNNTNSNTVLSSPTSNNNNGNNTNTVDVDTTNDTNNDIDKRSVLSSSSAIIQLQQKLQINEPSLWVRNVQLSFFTILIILVQQFYKSFIQLKKQQQSDNSTDALVVVTTTTTTTKSYFYGFTIWVWVLVLLQAGGGLLVAAVIKYTDNVLKGLATGVSVVVATICSTVLFHTTLSNQFIFGAIIILISVYYFNNPFPNTLSITSSTNNNNNNSSSFLSYGISKQEKRTLLPK